MDSLDREGLLQEKLPWWFYIDWIFVIWLAVPMSLFVGYIIFSFIVQLFSISWHVSFYLALTLVQGLIAGFCTRHAIDDLINRKIGNHWLLIYAVVFLTPAVIEAVLGQGELMLMGAQYAVVEISLIRILVVGLSFGLILAYFQSLALKPEAIGFRDPPYNLRRLNIATIVGVLAVQISNATLLLTYFWIHIIT